MTEETKDKVKLLIIPVPRESSDFHIIHGGTRVAYFYPTYHRIDIPKGKYTIIGKLTELNKENCKEIIEALDKINYCLYDENNDSLILEVNE
jgi:hypothetical protein